MRRGSVAEWVKSFCSTLFLYLRWLLRFRSRILSCKVKSTLLLRKKGHTKTASLFSRFAFSSRKNQWLFVIHLRRSPRWIYASLLFRSRYWGRTRTTPTRKNLWNKSLCNWVGPKWVYTHRNSEWLWSDWQTERNYNPCPRNKRSRRPLFSFHRKNDGGSSPQCNMGALRL